MHVTAHRQQEPLGAAKAAIFVGGQKPDIHQFGRAGDAVDIFADPVERLEIAQGPLAVLDIGLDDIAAVTHALVPRVAFGELLRQEQPLAALGDFVPEALAQLLVKRLIAPHQPAFEQGGADGEILLRHPHRVGDGAARMADLEAEIPQDVEHRLDHLFAPRRAAHRGDEGDVDIRMRRHLGAAVAPHRKDREAFGLRAVGDGVELGGDVIVDHPQQLVGEEGIAPRHLVPGRRRLGQPPRQLRPSAIERRPQRLDDRAAPARPVRGVQRGDLVSQRASINDRALAGDAPRRHGEGSREHHAATASLA